MADSNFTPQGSAPGANCFKEAVCINAGRVYDSCSDKDCVNNLRVYFTDCAQNIVNNATSIKCRGIQVVDAYMDVEPVPFNKGFYSVDITFYFCAMFEACTVGCLTPLSVEGLVSFTKKVILYGSEGNVNVFTSDSASSSCSPSTYTHDSVPRATVQVVTPMCLASRLHECCPSVCCLNVPDAVAKKFEGCFNDVTACKFVEITLGVFSIVSLERTVQIMVPIYDFCVPDKECVQSNDDPCELFKRIKFPINEFFPPRLNDSCDNDDCDCGI